MSPKMVTHVLAYFTAGWDWFDPGEAAEAVWIEALADTNDDSALIAAKRLVKIEERPPSIARFLAECRKVSRELRPQIRPGWQRATPEERQQAARISRAIRAGMAESLKAIPAHSGHTQGDGGDRNCPACSTRHERMDGKRHRHVPEILDAIFTALEVEES